MNFKRYHVSKNLWSLYPNQTYRGVTFVFADNKIKMSNTCTQEGNVVGIINLKAGTYTLTANANINISQHTHILQVYKADVVYETISLADMISGKATFTIAEDTTDIQIRIYVKNGIDYTGVELQPMLNTGSQPQPYEPYGDTWHDIPYYIMGTDTDTLTLPADIYADGTNATVNLKGNEEHTGTPSPQNPVDVNGVGEMSANLINVQPFTVAANDGSKDILLWEGTLPVGTYTISLYQDNELSSAVRNRLQYRVNGTFAGGEPATENYHLNSGVHQYTLTVENATDVIQLRFWANTLSNSCTYSNIMLNSGETALPYEPYGYKIPNLNNSTTYNKYLGEEQTTRNVKKLVLTGGNDENWSTTTIGTNDYIYRMELSALPKSGVAPISSHYTGSSATRWVDIANYEVTMSILNSVAIRHSGLTGVSDWKAYLQAQYQAGTPVTVWYVLATSATGIVNEPLMKIGNYADTLTTSIPTVDGANALSVGTTVQPSEVTANYHGWHPVSNTHVMEGLLADNPLCGISTYKYTLDMSNGSCTRNIKKYIFTGSENWRKSSSINGVYWTDGIIDDGNNIATGRILGISTHYKGVASNTGISGLNNNEIRIYASSASTIYHEVYLRDERFDTKEAFADWLTQQYTNGNPVTLWYVLATPTTETVTVPTGLSGTEEGYLTQATTPTPTNPVYPTANEVHMWN